MVEAPYRRRRSVNRSSSASIASRRPGSASSESRNPRRSEASSRSEKPVPRRSSPAARSSGASGSSGRDGPFGGRHEVSGALVLVGRDRGKRGGGSRRELAHVPQPLPGGAELVLTVGGEAVGVLDKGAQLVEPRPGCRGVARQRLGGAAGPGELAPRAAGLADAFGGPGEGIEHRKLVARARQPPLLELPAHREERLDGRRDVLPGRAASPRVGARPPVGEDAPGEHERLLAAGPQVGELAEHLVVGKVELGLDPRLAGGGAEHRGVAARPEQKPDRVREDRLPRAGLPRDRVQPGVELQLGLADQHEVLDTKPPQHPAHRTASIRPRRSSVRHRAQPDAAMAAEAIVGGTARRRRSGREPAASRRHHSTCTPRPTPRHRAAPQHGASRRAPRRDTVPRRSMAPHAAPPPGWGPSPPPPSRSMLVRPASGFVPSL